MLGFVIELSTRKRIADGLLRRYREPMAATTTIKVASATWERINDRAKAEGFTPRKFVEVLRDEHDRAHRSAAVRAGHAVLPPDDDDVETAEWDPTNADGIEGG